MKHTLFPLIWVIGSIVLALDYSPFRYGILLVASVTMLVVVHGIPNPFDPEPEKPKDPEQPEPHNWMDK